MKTKQKFFNFKFNNKIFDDKNFYINSTNQDAYTGILSSNIQNLFLTGPSKSGKSFIGNLWLNENLATKYNNNFDMILKNKKNILIDDFTKKDQEKIFHIINHCNANNLSILLISNSENYIQFLNLKDLISRVKTFSHFKINQPDDDMLLNILTKLFTEKQFIINSHDIFEFIIKRANRSYEEMFTIVKNLNNLSLEKKRELTIPLIKEIL